MRIDKILRPWIFVLILLALLGALYRQILADLVSQWWNDASYSHGFAVPLISGFIVWRRRAELAPSPSLRHLSPPATVISGEVGVSPSSAQRVAQFYAGTGKYDQALVKVTEALTVNPKSAVAHMLAGVLYERTDDIPKAIRAYEDALALDPQFVAAANNAAYLYAQFGGDQKKALQLARKAKQVTPDEPRVSDTLGWILFKRDVHQQALALLKESAAKLPDNPEVQYHLDMTQYVLGNEEAARQALSHALRVNQQFAGAEEARRALVQLRGQRGQP